MKVITPWVLGEIRKPAGVHWDQIISSADGSPIASVTFAGWDTKSAIAHARLIASAPELLVLLIECYVGLDSDEDYAKRSELSERVKTAIDKALGTS